MVNQGIAKRSPYRVGNRHETTAIQPAIDAAGCGVVRHDFWMVVDYGEAGTQSAFGTNSEQIWSQHVQYVDLECSTVPRT